MLLPIILSILVILLLILAILFVRTLILLQRANAATDEQTKLLKQVRQRLIKQSLTNQQQSTELAKLQEQNQLFHDKYRQSVDSPRTIEQHNRISAESKAIFRSYVVGLDYYAKDFENALSDAISRHFFAPYEGYTDKNLKADYLYNKKYRIAEDANIGEIQLVEEKNADGDRAVRVELKIANRGYIIGHLPKDQISEAYRVIDVYADSIMTLSSKTQLQGGEWKMAIDAVEENPYTAYQTADERRLPDFGAEDTPLQIKVGNESYFLQFTLYELQIDRDQIPLYSVVTTFDGQRGTVVTVDTEPTSYEIMLDDDKAYGETVTATPAEIDRVVWVPNWK